MNILIVYAHPDPDSLTAALKDVAVQQLRADGHTVRVSDLYAMGWKAHADADDFGEVAEDNLMLASGAAYRDGTARSHPSNSLTANNSGTVPITYWTVSTWRRSRARAASSTTSSGAAEPVW